MVGGGGMVEIWQLSSPQSQAGNFLQLSRKL